MKQVGGRAGLLVVFDVDAPVVNAVVAVNHFVHRTFQVRSILSLEGNLLIVFHVGQ